MQRSINRQSKLRYFIMGMINNNAYVVILSASSTLTKEFHKEKYQSLYSGCLVVFSILIRILNLKFLVRILHRIRICIVFIIALLGVISMTLSVYTKNFWLSLFGTVLIGIATTFGDLTNQGLMKEFQPIVFSGYSSGTGCAGVTGSLYFLVAQQFQLSLYVTFGSLIFLYLIYMLNFFGLVGLS